VDDATQQECLPYTLPMLAHRGCESIQNVLGDIGRRKPGRRGVE
jgi:hypothetical protein